MGASHCRTNTSASSPHGPLRNVTLGTMRYHAVPTGDNLAWSLPIPLTQCASSSISCPATILASRMSSCTVDT